MLIQFSVENYLSIKNRVVLSMLASRDKEHPEHLITDGNKNCCHLWSQCFRKIQCPERILVYGKLCVDFT